MKAIIKYLNVIFSVCIVSLAALCFSDTYAQETDFTDEVNQMLELVNEQRAKVGVNPIVLNDTLTEAAMLRADELIETFSHTRPDGTSCDTVLDDYKIACHSCGENIAAGSPTVELTMEQWIKSTGHYNNIISSDFDEIGIGIAYDPDSMYGYYWVQLFIDPKNPVQTTVASSSPTGSTTTTTSVSLPTEAEYNEKIQTMLTLVNNQRKAAGASPLTLNEKLCQTATLRAKECAELYDHIRPDGTLCYTAIDDAFIGYSTAAENIAAGSSDTELIMKNWVESPDHYLNMISSDFSEIGIGVVYIPDSEHKWYWVQLFIEPSEFLLTTSDVNNDGYISVADILIIKKYLLKIDSSSYADRLDVNRDKKINVVDFMYVKRVIMYS